jgi:hypothetical protein
LEVSVTAVFQSLELEIIAPILFPWPMKEIFRAVGFLLCTSLVRAATPYFGIHIVDEATGRGVPLVELRTVNDIRCVSDRAGWVAFDEPGLMGREVFFHVSGPGYTKAKDGFGFAGIRVTPRAGETTTVKLKRDNIAERIGRTTGQGIYRDCELIGLPVPLPNLNPAGVMGQDSVQAVIYRGRIFWLWGDTNVPNYPLGNYHTTCATSALDGDPEKGIALEYFIDTKDPKKLRQMMPMSGEGAVWLFGLLVVTNDAGKEILLAHYGRYRGLQPAEEHGIAEFNDEKGIFEKRVDLEKPESWRHLRGNAVRVKEPDGDYFYFSFPFCHTRVKATYRDVTTPGSYEALRFDEAAHDWRWQKDSAPTTQDDEAKFVKDGKIPKDRTRFDLTDSATGKPVKLHNSTVHWNEYRKKFVMIAMEQGGGPSYLGEVWYAESDSPAGPWHKPVKIASHPRYSFYNPVHHAFLDRDGGRIIYFEGTYSLEFSGNPIAPARYDYNELMYRLDLSDPRLRVE